MNAVVTKFEAGAHQVRWKNFYRKVCKEKSLKMLGFLNVREFQDEDQTWQKSDKDKGIRFLTRYIRQTDIVEKVASVNMLAKLCGM